MGCSRATKSQTRLKILSTHTNSTSIFKFVKAQDQQLCPLPGMPTPLATSQLCETPASQCPCTLGLDSWTVLYLNPFPLLFPPFSNPYLAWNDLASPPQGAVKRESGTGQPLPPSPSPQVPGVVRICRSLWVLVSVAFRPVGFGLALGSWHWGCAVERGAVPSLLLAQTGGCTPPAPSWAWRGPAPRLLV